jgi:hypothetical protein
VQLTPVVLALLLDNTTARDYRLQQLCRTWTINKLKALTWAAQDTTDHSDMYVVPRRASTLCACP